MKLFDFPEDVRPHLIPEPGGKMVYRCLGCRGEFPIETLLYTCPDCGQVLMIEDQDFDRIKKIPAPLWRRILDFRKAVKIPALSGIYLYHEFVGPVLPLDAVIYLGEGHTPVIAANAVLQEWVGVPFYFKNDGQNPSASFKDRGMASALSYINYLVRKGHAKNILAVCASTGDTSASAALYAAYLRPYVQSAVILPHQKVTPQQLSQPLGSGAAVFEIPGVFDDCMKIVEHLSSRYPVALLNSKNAWRILGQESYSFEIAQVFDYDVTDRVVVVPIGNAGNITAVLSGFLKFFEAGIIKALPKVIGVQSEHADPVYRYYLEPDPKKRRFVPVAVRPSVAQAAMIGNPVSMPRVIHLVDRFNESAGRQRVFFIEVTEQEIMDCQLVANRNGHIVCTHGGESLAGLIRAVGAGIVSKSEIAVLDSTAHAIKFSGFQERYFSRTLAAEFNVETKPELVNAPVLIHPKGLKVPEPGKPLNGKDLDTFVETLSNTIAKKLNLKKTSTP
ncbi:MAG: threonine synthase [Desulfobacterales bacterium CG07_land_8_20_14_0_80_52_14]|nr:MAG: threonine synthase [Desulfobacterales bacterium CG07_land_8_20_14_0_80_52_14]